MQNLPRCGAYQGIPGSDAPRESRKYEPKKRNEGARNNALAHRRPGHLYAGIDLPD
jgi:hypothetical protein